MRTRLCWSCGKLCQCNKTFPNGRPKRRSECPEFTEAPPEPKRITHKEMADMLGCSVGKIETLIASAKGVRYLTKSLARKGVSLTYERIKNRIYFYREEIDNDR